MMKAHRRRLPCFHYAARQWPRIFVPKEMSETGLLAGVDAYHGKNRLITNIGGDIEQVS